jgi:hypothetical protein
MIEIIKEWYELISLIVSGVFVAYVSYSKIRKKKEDSKDLLYGQLEKLRVQVIESVSKDILNAKTIAKKDFILEELSNRCPECYNEVMNKIKK